MMMVMLPVIQITCSNDSFHSDEHDDEEMEPMEHSDSGDSSHSLIRFIIIIFFRIVHKYCISKNAASKILALIYFALSMLHSNLISYLHPILLIYLANHFRKLYMVL